MALTVIPDFSEDAPWASTARSPSWRACCSCRSWLGRAPKENGRGSAAPVPAQAPRRQGMGAASAQALIAALSAGVIMACLTSSPSVLVTQETNRPWLAGLPAQQPTRSAR